MGAFQIIKMPLNDGLPGLPEGIALPTGGFQIPSNIQSVPGGTIMKDSINSMQSSMQQTEDEIL